MSKRYKNKTANLLVGAGWNIEATKGGHLIARCPDIHDGGKSCRLVMPSTSRNWRGPLNALALARKNHPELGREITPTKKETPVSSNQKLSSRGRPPGETTTRNYEDAVAFLVAYPDTPFNGAALTAAGVDDSMSALKRMTQLSKLTLRLAGGGFRTGSEAQRYWDEIQGAHGGGLIYRCPSPITGARKGWYVVDTQARLGDNGGIEGNRWPVVGDDHEIFQDVAPAPPPQWVEQDNGAFRQVDNHDGHTINVGPVNVGPSVEAAPVPEQTELPEPAPTPVPPAEPVTTPEPADEMNARVLARFNGGGWSGSTPDQMVIAYGESIHLVTIERTTAAP